MNLEKIHKNCAKIFNSELIENADSASTACKVYDALTEGKPNGSDCIGENFNKLIHNLYNNWFENYKPKDDLDYYFYNYILLLYLFAERIEVVFNILNADGKSKLFIDFQHHNFKTLDKITKWANFIKHPKEFLFTHWPKYYIEGDNTQDVKKNKIVINSKFIFDHYSSEKCARPKILERNKEVYVEIPKFEVLTKDFCNELNTFFNFICENKLVAEYLKKKSTIEDYYSNETYLEN